MSFLDQLEALPWHLGLIISASLLAAFSILGLLFISFYSKSQRLKNHHDVAGYIFANFGVVYAVVLGFTVVNAQQRFDKLQEISQLEASYLTLLYNSVDIFPSDSINQFHTSIQNYAYSVIYQEWNSMSEGKASVETAQSLKQVQKDLQAINPITSGQQAWFQQSIKYFSSLIKNRQLRLLGADEYLSNQMWFILIFGALIMVAFTWFFKIESLRCHILMSTSLAAMTASLLFLIFSLDTAYSGEISVTPQAMIEALDSFQQKKIKPERTAKDK